MVVTRRDVLHVAGLARLRMSEEELDRLTNELNGILAHMEDLGELDLGDVAAVGDATEWNAPLRADRIQPDPLNRPPSELAPSVRDGFFTVPRLAALDGGDGQVAE